MMRDLERYTRNIRNENRTTITLGKGEPKPNEGVEGDVRINTTTGGLRLYAKYQGQWYSTGLAKVLNRPKKISELSMQSSDTIITDSTGGASSNTINDTTSSVKDDLASLASKINVMAVAINKILERLQ
tara:strand:- start:874 stop:1260 length:387 start_codon:yes stop_codon:yes gene_type:complete